ncbi:hypothetical protein OHU45_26740 [Streptomyces tubercidicus]|uniref:hypothetical protein n=1 Tax=Streptomyces tubercidicus TaxID=47759 RepID=UPI0030DE95F9
MGIAMPDESKLPRGPLRDLVAAVHDLYVDAAMPGASRISRLIRERDDLPDTVSHEMVGKLLHGQALPRWEKLQCVVQQLCDMAVSRPAAEKERVRFHALWLAAARDRQPRPKAAAPAEPCSLLMLEVRNFAGLTDPEAEHLRYRLHAAWSDVLRRLGADRTVLSNDTGDGWVFWEAGTGLVSNAYDELLPALAESLHEGNEEGDAGLPLRLSGSLHVADVFTTETGLHGPGVNEAARFLDAPVVRSAVAEVASEVAVAVSAQACDAAGLRAKPNYCLPLLVPGSKGWDGGRAWLYTPRPWRPDWGQTRPTRR